MIPKWPPGGLWAPLGRQLPPDGRRRATVESLLVASWGRLGGSWAALAASWAALGASWGRLGPPGTLPGGSRGGSRRQFGAMFLELCPGD